MIQFTLCKDKVFSRTWYELARGNSRIQYSSQTRESIVKGSYRTCHSLQTPELVVKAIVELVSEMK